MRNQILMTGEQLDYLRELTNIGAGNAAAALSTYLRYPVTSDVPEVRICPPNELVAAIGAPDEPSIGVKIELTGDISGICFFIVRTRVKQHLADLVRLRGTQIHAFDDNAVFRMVADLITISHFDAVNRFCGLDIHQSNSVSAIDMAQALIDEAIALTARDADAILIGTTFAIGDERVRTTLLLLPDPDSVSTLLGSIAEATRRISGVAV